MQRILIILIFIVATLPNMVVGQSKIYTTKAKGSTNVFDTTHVSFWFNTDSIDTLLNSKIDTLYSYCEPILATMNTGANQPTLVKNIAELNNNNVIHFDGVDDNLVLNNNTNIQTIFVVANWSGTETTFPNYNGIINKYSFDSSPYYLFMGQNGSNNLYSGGGSLFGSNIYINNVNSLDFSDFNNYKIIRATSTTSTEFTPLQIGGSLNNSSRFWKGDIAEIIAFDTILSTNQLADVNRYIQNKYAPPVDLLSDITIPDSFKDTTISTAEKPWFTNYQWNTGDATSTLTVNSSGVYSVTVTDIFGFVSTDSIKVTYPVFNQQADTTICLGDTIVWDLQPTGSYTYLWNTGATTPAISISNAGQYWVTITDSKGNNKISDTLTILVDSFAVKNSLGADRSICQRQNVTLTEQTSDIVSWLWNTTDTTNFITIDSAGTYWVEVSNSRGCKLRDSVTYSLSGYSPIVNFSADTVCLGDSTTFLNNTTVQSPDSIVSWQWIFGNNDTSIVKQPKELYLSADTFNVKLIATANTGCSNYYTDSVLIKQTPKANFTVQYGNTQCTDKNILFTDKSDTILYVNNYFWNFGDGATSNSNITNHNYTQSGNFQIEHSVTLTNGCSDTTTQTITIADQLPTTTSFELLYPQNNFNLFKPDSLIEFSWDTSTNVAFYGVEISQDSLFGSFILDTVIDTTHFIYSLQDTGTYYWRISANNLCYEKVYSKIRTIDYKKLNTSHISFWLDASKVDTITGGLIDTWTSSYSNIVANQLVNGQRPVLKTNISEINNTSVITFDGVDDCLDIDSSTSIQTMFIIANWNGSENAFPDFNGLINRKTLDIAPYYIFMGNKNDSTLYTGGGSFFENNILINNVVNNNFKPFNKYKLLYGSSSSKGDFSNLQIGGSLNNSSRFWKGDIAEIIAFDTIISAEQLADVNRYIQYKYTPPVNLLTDITISYSLQDTTISTAEKPWFTSYQWSTGDTTSTLTVNSSGIYSVTATDIFGFVSTDSIKVTYPVFNQQADTTICLGDTIVWDLQPTGSYTYLWNTGATTQAVSISNAGQYWVTITDSKGNNKISDTLTILVDSFPIYATLGNDTSMCIGNKLKLTNWQDSVQDFLWNNQSTSNFYLISQAEQISLIAKNNRGCYMYDTINVDIHGTAPKANFMYDKLCRNNTVNFTNLSQSLDGSTINMYAWKFDTLATDNQQDAQYTFTDTGLVNVKLTISTDAGCSNDTSMNLFINELPEAQFTPLLACQNSLVNFISNSTSTHGTIQSLLWDIDGQPVTTENPKVVFTNAGDKTVKLIVETDKQCMDSITNKVNVQASPTAEFKYDSICLNKPIGFNNLSQANLGLQFSSKWIIDNKDTINTDNPELSFNALGTHTAKLIVSQIADGCTDTLTKTVYVHDNPTAKITSSIICEDESISLLNNSNAGINEEFDKFIWIVNDTVLLWGNSPKYIFKNSGENNIVLSVYNKPGCFNNDTLDIDIYNTPNFELLDIPDTIFINDSIKPTINGDVDNYQWIINDSLISTEKQPVIHFDSVGTYFIKLYGFNNSGCENTRFDTVRVLKPQIDANLLECRAIIDNNKLIVSADIANDGTLDLKNSSIHILLSNNQEFYEQIDDKITSGKTITYKVKAQYMIPNSEIIDWMQIDIVAAEDINTNNNSCTHIFGNTDIVYSPFPIPANENLFFNIISTKPANAKITIVSSMGEVIYNEKQSVANGLNNIKIDNPAPHIGVCSVIIELNNKQNVFRVIL